jgi:ribosome-associated toxin RatA of RatAB toxin-antitoxin module
MKHVKRSVLLWYSPHEMYALVTDVAKYPEFLPWCERAETIEQRDDGVTAKLHLSYAGVKQSFTTRNTNDPDKSVLMQLVDGPFSKLEGIWRFNALQPAAGAADSGPKACKIEFELHYEFSNFALQLVVSPVFDRIANTFVDAFVSRAEQVYGAR